MSTNDRALVHAAPGWLRDLGITSWLLVGVTLLLVGAVWLLSLTRHDRHAGDHRRRRRRGRLAAWSAGCRAARLPRAAAARRS